MWDPCYIGGYRVPLPWMCEGITYTQIRSGPEPDPMLLYPPSTVSWWRPLETYWSSVFAFELGVLGLVKCCSILNSWHTQALPLSKGRTSGVPCSSISFSKMAWATVVASFSGMAFAMGHPVRWSTIISMFLLWWWEVGNSTISSRDTFANALPGISVVCNWYLSACIFSHCPKEQLSTWPCMCFIILGQ